jgi:hypothetical protein
VLKPIFHAQVSVHFIAFHFAPLSLLNLARREASRIRSIACRSQQWAQIPLATLCIHSQWNACSARRAWWLLVQLACYCCLRLGSATTTAWFHGLLDSNQAWSEAFRESVPASLLPAPIFVEGNCSNRPHPSTDAQPPDNLIYPKPALRSSRCDQRSDPTDPAPSRYIAVV